MATPLYGRLIGPTHIKTLSLVVLVAAAFVHPAQAASGSPVSLGKSSSPVLFN